MRVEMNVGDVRVYSEPGVYEIRFGSDGVLFVVTRSGSGGAGGMGLSELGETVFGEVVPVPEPVYHDGVEVYAGMSMKFTIPDIARGGSSALLRGVDGVPAVVALVLRDEDSSFVAFNGGDGESSDDFALTIHNPERVPTSPPTSLSPDLNGWHYDFN